MTIFVYLYECVDFHSYINLSAFTEPLSPRLLALEVRYGTPNRPEEVMAKFDIGRIQCDQLREEYIDNCTVTADGRPQLPLESWLLWTEGFLAPRLAGFIFSAKVGLVRNSWRFDHFVDFSSVFGSGTQEEQVMMTYISQ